MKTLIALLGTICLTCSARAANDALTILAGTKATVTDEMFHFVVTYSDVRCESNTLYFTETLRHDDVLDSYYIVTIKAALPFDALSTAQRKIDEGTEVSHHHALSITFQPTSTNVTIKRSAVTKNTEGAVTTEESEPGELSCDVYFASKAKTEEWNAQLSKLISAQVKGNSGR